MKIETKFNLNEEVWYIYYWDNKWTVGNMLIYQIVINTNGIIYNGIYERQCFKTKGEAKKECVLRNGNI